MCSDWWVCIYPDSVSSIVGLRKEIELRISARMRTGPRVFHPHHSLSSKLGGGAPSRSAAPIQDCVTFSIHFLRTKEGGGPAKLDKRRIIG